MHVWAAVKKYHRRTQVGIEPPTSWLLHRRHTTRPPRLPDGYGWFDSHNSSRYCVGLSINDFGSLWFLCIIGFVFNILILSLCSMTFWRLSHLASCSNKYAKLILNKNGKEITTLTKICIENNTKWFVQNCIKSSIKMISLLKRFTCVCRRLTKITEA